LLTLLLALFPCAAATDEDAGWAHEYVDESPAWQEQGVELPPWPEPGRLLEVAVNRANFPFRVYIDPDSVSIGDDGVLRYTVVVVSTTGSRNISYEGMRCSKRSYRRYAYGAGGGWSPLEGKPWRQLLESGMDNYRYVLYRDYLCDPTDPYQKVEDVLQRVRYFRGPSVGE